MSTLSWELDRHRARFQAAGFRLELDLTRPDDGLTLVLPGVPAPQPAQVLGIAMPGFTPGNAAAILEPLLRGADLVVGYRPPPQWPVELDARWRRLPPDPEAGDLLAVELLLSLHTQSLDSRPALTVQSRLAATDELSPAGAPSCFVFRLPGDRWSYVEMVHPADARGEPSASASSSTMFLVHRLFPDFLEKGVILRARLRAAVVPRDNDVARAATLWRGFLASQTPLD